MATADSPGPASPAQVVMLPPASVITGYSAETSQRFMAGSSMTSARPDATIEVAVAVAPAANAVGPVEQRLPGAGVEALHCLGTGGEQCGFAQFGGCGNSDSRAVERSAEPPGGGGGFAGSVAGDNTDDGHPTTLERNERPEKRHVVDEGLRTVDGVEDPAVVAVASGFAELLAQHAVAGAFAKQELPDCLLGAAVGGGHRRAIRLEFDSRAVAVERHDDPLRDLRRLQGNSKETAQILRRGIRHRTASPRR